MQVLHQQIQPRISHEKMVFGCRVPIKKDKHGNGMGEKKSRKKSYYSQKAQQKSHTAKSR